VGQTVFRYTFNRNVPLEEVEGSLILAEMAAESLYGVIDVTLDARFMLDKTKRACVIDASTQVGRDVNRLFAGFLSREFSGDAYSVELVERETVESAA
jgi:hypothetical protein